jgi:hypothetical protein
MTTLRSILIRARHSELVQVTLLLSLGIAIIFWQVLLLGYVQVPGDIPSFYDPVMAEAMPERSPPQNPLLSDHINQFYVWHSLAAKGMQTSGKIPLWNPNMLAGQPLVANSQPALFYPPNLLLRWLDPGVVASIRSMFNLFVAGFFTFLLSRELRFSKSGAMLSAVAFSFSGALIVGPGHAYANSMVWLPFTLWTIEKMLKQSSMLFWALMTSIGIGLSILGGHPESTFHNALVIALYMAARLLWLKASTRIKLQLIMSFVLAVVVGLMLGAVQWLPFVSWLSYSANSTQSRSAAWGAESVFYSSSWLSNLALLLTLIFPGFFGNPVDGTYRWPFSTFQNYLEQSMYIGLIPLALMVGAVIAPKKRKYMAMSIFAVMAIVLLAVALRLPGFEVVNHLPIFDRVNNTRLKWYFSFLAAILAGFGLDRFAAALAAHKASNKRIIYPVTAVFATALVILLGVVAGKYVLTPALEIHPDSFIHHFLFDIFSWRHFRTTITIFVLVVGSVILLYAFADRQSANFTNIKCVTVYNWTKGNRDTSRKRGSSPNLFQKWNPVSLKSALLFLTFVELVVLAYAYNTTLSKDKIFPAVRLTETLEQDPDVFRILAVPPTFWPNYGAVYGLFHVGGYDLPVFGRYADIYEAQGGSGYRQSWSPDWPLVDWMNIKYVISPEAYELEKLELVYEDGYRVYRNKDVLPRAYMVHDTQVIDSDEKMLETLTGGDIDLGRTVLLENELPVEQQSAITRPSVKTGTSIETTRITLFANDRVELEVETETPGVLVMSDVLSPGWKAMVDERPAALHRANYTFRAVFVPAGAHRVTFFYQPLDFQIGSILSLLGLLVLGIGLPLSWATGRTRASS